MRTSVQMVIQNFQEFLASKVANIISLFASGLGIASLTGLVSLGAAILSFTWLAIQVFNYFTFTLPRNIREKERDRARAEFGASSHFEQERYRKNGQTGG